MGKVGHESQERTIGDKHWSHRYKFTQPRARPKRDNRTADSYALITATKFKRLMERYIYTVGHALIK